jgi:hypothetical protein
MGKGKEIMAWNEPKEWLRAVKALAKSDGITIYGLKPWMPVFALIGGLMAYEWSQADPEKRPSPLGAALVFLILCSVLLGLARIKLALDTTRTSLRENGMLHGRRFSPRWIPYDAIEIFWIEHAEAEGLRFCFLTWFEAGEEEERYAVIPEALDPQRIVKLLKSKSVKQDFPSEVADGEG